MLLYKIFIIVNLVENLGKSSFLPGVPLPVFASLGFKAGLCFFWCVFNQTNFPGFELIRHPDY